LCCWQMHDSNRTSRWESPPPPTHSICMLTARYAGRHTVLLIVNCPVLGTRTDKRNSAQLNSTEKYIHRSSVVAAFFSILVCCPRLWPPFCKSHQNHEYDMLAAALPCPLL
jgi:hypothetical protein